MSPASHTPPRRAKRFRLYAECREDDAVDTARPVPCSLFRTRDPGILSSTETLTETLAVWEGRSSIEAVFFFSKGLSLEVETQAFCVTFN